jgi:hypothetical protein
MLSAFQAIGGLGELRLLHLQARFYDECNEHMTAIDDDIFAPIVQGCTKLRELALANVLGLGSRTWSDLGRHATELETVSLNFNYLVHRRGATMPALRGTADGYPLTGLLSSRSLKALRIHDDGWGTLDASPDLSMLLHSLGVPTFLDLVQWATEDQPGTRCLQLPEGLADALEASAFSAAPVSEFLLRTSQPRSLESSAADACGRVILSAARSAGDNVARPACCDRGFSPALGLEHSSLRVGLALGPARACALGRSGAAYWKRASALVYHS